MITRRDALKTTALVTAICATGGATTALAQTSGKGFELPALPYALDALEPHVDAKTMEIHHGRHHAAYVTNLNKALADQPAASKPIEDLLKDLKSLPENIRTAVRNNGGGHYNHSLFWQMMKKGGGGQPGNELGRAIDANFGNLQGFKDKFAEAATKVFGSGWAWLIAEGKTLKVISTPNQDTPIMGLHGETPQSAPLLGLDVWEHAYYLKYQNRRADYIAAWFNVVNWDFVADRFSRLSR